MSTPIPQKPKANSGTIGIVILTLVLLSPLLLAIAATFAVLLGLPL